MSLLRSNLFRGALFSGALFGLVGAPDGNAVVDQRVRADQANLGLYAHAEANRSITVVNLNQASTLTSMNTTTTVEALKLHVSPQANKAATVEKLNTVIHLPPE